MSRFDRRYSPSQSNPDDDRAAGRKDRDRILYSSAFRRLSGITQVVDPNERFPVHNRLTHSLKVAQVGRSIAERLLRLDPELAQYLDPDVVESACLAHDLGHPPFGHNTERELERLLSSGRPDQVVHDGYEGNAQSFRIVTRLAVRYLEHAYPGLNLTRATLNALLKYPWGRSASGPHSRKWGYYSSEEEDFRFARAESPGEARSIEAELMDWSDDVTYGVHDLEDFFRAGMLPLDRLVDKDDQGERQRFIGWFLSRKPEYSRDQIEATLNPLYLGVPGPFRGARSDRAMLRTFTSLLINQFVNSVQVDWADPEFPQLAIDHEIKVRIEVLKALTTFYVIESPSLLSQRYGQRRIIRSLFEIYLDAATTPKRPDIAIFPMIVRDAFAFISADNEQENKRLVADLISSMSEGQVLDAYKRLTGQSLGSVIDPIA